MQQQFNELELLISEAFRRGKPAYLAPVLGIIYNKADVGSCSLQRTDIEKLNRLSYKADSVSIYYIVGLTYDLILSYKLINVVSFNSEMLLNMANSLLPVLDNIKGTSLSYRIALYIQALFYLILERKDIPSEEAALINSLLAGENLKIGEILNNFEENEDAKEIMELSKSNDIEDKISSVIKLMELLTHCSSFQEQIELFAQKTLPALKFIVSGTNETYMELFEILGTFLETMLFQFQHSVRFDRKCFDLDLTIEKNLEAFVHVGVEPENKQLNANEVFETMNKEFSSNTSKETPKIVVPYILSDQVRKLRETEGVYTAVSFVLNIFILYPKYIDLQLVSIRILERLYYLFPAQRNHMEEAILILMSHFNSETSEEIRKPAAIFLYKLIHRDASPSLKAELEKRDFQSLTASQHYNSAALTAECNEAEISDFQDLHIRVGSPLNTTIEAGTVKSEYVEVWQPYSILSFGFGVLQHDINFSIERVARFKRVLKYEKDEPFTIIKSGKIDSAKHPVNGSVLIKEPGIYRIDFDNKSSWFNAKTVRYRILVLSPKFEDSFELKTKHAAILDATLGPTLLPSIVFAPDFQPVSDPARRVQRPANNNTSMILSQKDISNTRALVYLNSRAVEFSIVSVDKEYEIVLNYESEEKIDWERVNTRISDVMKKIFEPNINHEDKKIDIQVVYDEAVLEKIVAKDRFDVKFHELVEDYFFGNLSLLSKIKKTLKVVNVQIITEMEFQVQKLLRNESPLPFKSVVLMVIDHAAKGIYCKFRKESRQIADINLDDFALPVSRVVNQSGDEEVELRPAELLFFSQGQSERKRLGYLAFLVHTIFTSSNRSIQNFAIIEDVPILFEPKKSNRALLKEMVDACHEKYKNEEGASEYALNVHFCEDTKDTNIKL